MSDHQVSVVCPTGRLDVNNHRQCISEIKEMLAAGVPEVQVDLGEVVFLDTFGLGVLVKGCRLAEQYNADFRVVGVKHEAVKLIFEFTNIERLFVVEYA